MSLLFIISLLTLSRIIWSSYLASFCNPLFKHISAHYLVHVKHFPFLTYFYFNDVQRDIFLICSNATSVHPERSKYHEVVCQIKQKGSSYSSLFLVKFWIIFVQLNIFQAEDISRYAKWTFEALSVDPQHLNLDFSQSKKRPNTKAQKGRQRTPRRVAPKQSGMRTCSSYNIHIFLAIMFLCLHLRRTCSLLHLVLVLIWFNFSVIQNCNCFNFLIFLSFLVWMNKSN